MDNNELDHPDSTVATAVPDDPNVPPTNSADAVDQVGEDDPQHSLPESVPVGAVPGSKPDPAPPEVLGEPQPLEPLPVPASGAPAQDAVSLNEHLDKSAVTLRSVAYHIEAFLGNHPAFDVVQDIRKISNKLESLRK
jgi:hypothetical protein